jgi:hypothetical protein
VPDRGAWSWRKYIVEERSASLRLNLLISKGSSGIAPIPTAHMWGSLYPYRRRKIVPGRF